MPKIIVHNLANTVINYNNNSKSVLDILLDNGIDWMHACGAKGRCTTCKMTVVTGENNMNELGASEKKFLSSGRLLDNQRLACQAKAWGDIQIIVPKSSKMPHIKYSD